MGRVDVFIMMKVFFKLGFNKIIRTATSNKHQLFLSAWAILRPISPIIS